MSLFGFLKKHKAPESSAPEPQDETPNYEMVIVQFFYGIEDIGELHQLEQALNDLISESGVGEYKGHEISLDFGDGYLFLLGPNAEKIYACIKPLLESYYFMDKSIATLRTGDFQHPEAKETDYQLRFAKFQSN